MTSIARVNEDLTNRAKKIFGDIVQDVLICLEVYDDRTINVLAEYEGHHDHQRRNGVNDSIDLDWGDIIVRFTNGKIVKFHTSEWGDITTAGKFEEII